MAKATINGNIIHYMTRGGGRDLVLIHGLSGDMASWHPVVVGRLAEDHTVTMLDLRGHGRSGMPSSGYTTRDMAADVTGLLDHLGIARAHLVGHSFGGAVALHTAVLYPRRVDGLVVADTRIRTIQKRKGVKQWAHWKRVREWLGRHGVEVPEKMSDPDIGLLRCLAQHRVAGRLKGLSAEPFVIPFSMGTVRRAEQWLALMSRTTAAADYKAPAGLTPAVIEHVTAPTLAVYGGLSHCLPTQADLVELMLDCTAATIGGVGHFLPLAAPAAFAEEVVRFLRRISARQRLRDAASAGKPALPARTRPRPAGA